MSYYPDLDKPIVRAFYQKAELGQLKNEQMQVVEQKSSGLVVRGVKKILKAIPGIRTLYSMAACYKDNGWAYTKEYFFGQNGNPDKRKDHVGIGGETAITDGLSIPASLSAEEEERQRETVFDRAVKISILTPLYNTPADFLTEMIESVQGQTYGNWELCLSDCSDGTNAEWITQICKEYAEKDPRIVYQKAEKQLGISENTNRCIEISSGDYFALLDHDDILHKGALFEIAKAVNEQNADFIYSDEAKFETAVEEAFAPNYKPGFAPDELRAHNYICHLTAFSRELLDQCGLYRPECDGSQDHDMVLRLTEKAKSIVHIPKVLYFWRVHQESVSAGIETKYYAIDAAKRAIFDQTKRLGYPVRDEITSIPPFPSLYRVHYQIDQTKSVAIVISHAEDPVITRTCITRLDEHQIWHDVEIFVLCEKEQEEQLKQEFFCAPTVWPIHVMSSSLTDVEELIHSDYVLFTDSHAYLDTDNWIEEMAGYARREDVGAVGGKIWNPSARPYDLGGYLMADGSVKRVLPEASRLEYGYEALLWHPRNATIVSGVFLFMKTEDLKALGGISEEMGDSWAEDLCVRLCLKGKRNVALPFVEATMNENRTLPEITPAFRERYKGIYQEDPYLNPNLIPFIYGRG